MFPHHMLLSGGDDTAFADLTFAVTDSGAATGSGNTATFSGLSFGATPSAGEARFIVVMFMLNKSGVTLSSMEIDGVAPIELARYEDPGGGNIVLAYREIAAGTTGSAKLTSTNGGHKYVGVYRVIGDAGSALALSGSAVGASGANPILTIPAVKGGIVFGGTLVINGSQTNWTGLTERFERDANSNEWGSGAADAIPVSGSRTITTSVTGNDPMGMSACIIPSA